MKKDFFNDTDNEFLISSLRQEVGELIQAWVVYKETKYEILNINDKIKLEKLYIVIKSLKNDIINRISELTEKKKYNQINFDIATKKLGIFTNEFQEFEKFVTNKGLRYNRHNFISHKHNFQNFDNVEGKYIIKDLVVLKAIAKSIDLMKKIDQNFYGEDIKFNWHEIRKSRYDIGFNASSDYILLPFIKIKSNKL